MLQAIRLHSRHRKQALFKNQCTHCKTQIIYFPYTEHHMQMLIRMPISRFDHCA